MTEKLTAKQQRVYDYFVRSYDVKMGYPTYAQASKDLWLAPSVIFAAINHIIKKWYAWKDNQWKLHFLDDEPQDMNGLEDYALSWLMESRVWPKIAKAVAIWIHDLALKNNKSIEDVVMDIVTED